MTEQASVRQVTVEEAWWLTEQIKSSIRSAVQLITTAYLGRVWVPLGYTSWDAYCNDQFADCWLSVPREDIRATVGSLREAGLSLRAIASVTAQSKDTVSRQLAGVSNSRASETPDQQSVTNWPPAVQGMDGKVYTPPPPPDPGERFPYGTGLVNGVHPGAPLQPPQPAPVPRVTPLVTVEVLVNGSVQEQQMPGPLHPHKFTEQEPDGGISWARWSWNPVTGCLHGCEYCYARALAYRWTEQYPEFGTGDRFIPMLRPYRLDGPRNTTVPAAHASDPSWRRVFVCSMADLYGRWVPDQWISRVHEAMLASPQWQYILLTKFPARYASVQLPAGAWVGTSVDEQKRVRIAEQAFAQLGGSVVKWLSLEPLREELEFTDLSMFDWVVIGGQTQTAQPTGIVPAQNPPSREHVMRLTLQAKEAGCQVHWKPNIRQFMWYDEYPLSQMTTE